MDSDELRYREFKRNVRGYSPDEVDDLLDSAADELDEARAERDRLSSELAEAQSRIEQYENLEGSIRATLNQAEKAASEYQETARREAESIVRDAEQKARRMLAETYSKIERIQDSYEALRETRSSLDTELRSLLERYLQLLDEADSVTANEIEAPLRERLDTQAISEAHDAAAQERQEDSSGTPEEVDQADVRDGNEDAEPESGAADNEETDEAPVGEEIASEADSTSEAEGPRRGFLRRRG